MNEEQAAKLEVLELELETVQILRRRAKDNALKAKVAAERELELGKEIEKLKLEAAA